MSENPGVHTALKSAVITLKKINAAHFYHLLKRYIWNAVFSGKTKCMAKTGDCVVKHGANFTTGMAMVVSTFMLQRWNLAVVDRGKGSRET